MIIAFDGPAGSGKTTISQELSRFLNIPCLNTGSMYRSVAYISLLNDITDIKKLCKMVAEIKFEFIVNDDNYQLVVNNKNISKFIEDPSILHLTSKIARYKEVRDILTDKQKKIISNRSMIVEGRDIGTVVAPDAEFKFFIDASIDIRTKRLLSMLPQEKKENISFDDLKIEVMEIDKRDKIYEVLDTRDDYIHFTTSIYSSSYEAKRIFDTYFTIV